MSSPSERIFAQLEEDDGTELRDFLPLRARHPMTLARTANRIAEGVTLREAVADFVDDLRWARDADDVAQRIVERPRDLDQRADAYLGALAEHVAAARQLPAPAWSLEPGRFLSRIWWPRYPGLWARAIAALDLPDGWLNDAVKGFLQGPDNYPTKTFDMPGLRCEVASAETVLVLKCLAHRLGEDDHEIRQCLQIRQCLHSS